MSRFALLFTEQEASCYLPDKEFRSSLLLTGPKGLGLDLPTRTSASGPVISAGLSMSPWRTDCLFASRGGGWRTVSEDSQVGGWLPPVHLLHDAGDLRNAVHGQVRLGTHQRQDLAEPRQILRLSGS
jgi:hypothetical protein